MVNGKRVLALCVSKDGNEETLVYINKIYEMAKERDYICIVYTMTSDVYENTSGDNFPMAHTINFDFVDAVIIINDYRLSDANIDEIIACADKAGKPRILIGDIRDNAFSLMYQGDNCFDSICRHVIEHHKCKNVYCMAGIKEASYTQAWLDTYKKVLENNGLEYDESKVGYGQFWELPTRNQVLEWAKKWHDKSDIPDAIVCTSDSMALAVCDTLRSLGYLVPGNIIVTGFEGTQRGRCYYPRLTTAEKDENATCDIVMEVIESTFDTGEFFTMNVVQQYVMQAYDSCGCNKATVNYADNLSNELYGRLEAFNAHEAFIFNLAGKASECTTKYEVAKVYSEALAKTAYLGLRADAFDADATDCTVKFDDTLDVITGGSSLKCEQKKTFPLGIFLPNYTTIDQVEDLISVYPISYDKKLYGYYVTYGKDGYADVYGHNRIVNMTNVCMNMVRVNNQYRRANDDLMQHHIRESLTGLYNMKGFIKGVQEKYINDIRNRKFVLIAIDIERLKSINEGFGHQEGDRALITVADILRSNVSNDEVVAKYGIDEYLVAFFTKEDPEYTVYTFLNGVYASLKNYNKLNGKSYNIGLNTAYITREIKNAYDLDGAIKEVSNLKRNNKENNNNNSDVEISEQDREDYSIFDDVIRNNKIRYMFQPLVNAKNGDIYAYEALMRTSEGINMSPVRIVELGMKYGRLDDVERATIYNVFEAVSNNKELFEGKKVFVNSIITNRLSFEELNAILEKYKDIASQIVVEVTEHTDVELSEYKAVEKFLSGHGIQIAIDDYGTGYANTVRLMQYSPSYVKIDRVLINGVHSDFKKQHFVENIINYAHKYGFMAIAEGVETSSELKSLLLMDVDLIQGYYTARPSFEVVQSIDANVKSEIVHNLETINGNVLRRTYITGADTEVQISKLLEDKYTEILVSGPKFKIIGSDDIMAQINIRLEDNKETEITIENVNLDPNFVDHIISIGENSKLTLIVHGKNRFEGKGVIVPETSSISIIGDGSLSITAEALYGFGIGNTFKNSHGNIYINLPGGLTIKTEGDNGVAIGAGSNESDAVIEIEDSDIKLEVASIKSIGIGSCFDDANLRFKNSKIYADVKGRVACGFGSIDGGMNIDINDSKIKLISSGDMITGIGSIRDSGGHIDIAGSKLNIDLNGKEGCAVGAEGGKVDVSIKDTVFRFTAEGASMLTVGTRDKNATIVYENVKEEINVTSAHYNCYGAKEENITKK